MTAEPEIETPPEEQWLTLADARRQARDYVLSFLPEEPDMGGDCEACRVIKAIAAGLGGDPDDNTDTGAGGDQPEVRSDPSTGD